MKTKWDLSKNEKKAFELLEGLGFKILQVTQYISKTRLTVEKDGIIEDFEIPSAVTNVKGYVSMLNKSFEMEKQILMMMKETE